ncbi:MAG: tyrosine--tRNA ligase, partial [Acidimicrobiales bacterium]
LLSETVLAANSEAIATQIAPYADGGLVVDNSEWLASARLLEFLRDVGKTFSVNEMVRKDSVRTRLEAREQGISFTEFSYMLIQAWDFLQLFDRHECRLQLGGSDQWGNIAEGIDLIRRRREQRAFGITSPLVLNADGTKFGKTEAGNVWLSAQRTSPYTFFQFWYRSEDSVVGSYLRRFTFLDRETIEALEALPAAGREAQRVLAREVTTAVHGPDEASRAERASSALFTAEVTSLDQVTLATAILDAPITIVSREEVAQGMPLLEALLLSGLSASRSAARRDLEGGGVYVNGVRQAAERSLILDDALFGRWILLRRGRATMHVLSLEG